MKKLFIILAIFAFACKKDDSKDVTPKESIAIKKMGNTKWEVLTLTTENFTDKNHPEDGKMYFEFAEPNVITLIVDPDNAPAESLVRSYEKRNDTLIVFDHKTKEWYKIEEYTEEKLTLNNFKYDYGDGFKKDNILNRLKFIRHK